MESPPELAYAGEAFTASAAWDTLRGAHFVTQGWSPLVVPVWGLNQQCSALLLKTLKQK
jgi:hypothetical protein